MPSATGRRTHNVRLIKTDWTYTVDEISQLFSVHPNAVRRWIKAGLETIDTSRPILIHGSDLRAFVTNRQKARKQKCSEGEFYCCRCRAPRRPWENLVDLVPVPPSKVMLKAICSECSTKMHRAGTLRKRPEYERVFDIQTGLEERLIE